MAAPRGPGARTASVMHAAQVGAAANNLHHFKPNEFYDPETVSGIAFGLGTTRMAAQKAGIDKLKPLYDQELPLLRALFRGQ